MSSVDHGHESEQADAPAEQITLDGSVGSDTDIGGHLRSDSVTKDGSDSQHHARSNSVKKPTTFKAVSVTKNFLAKAGTPTTPAAKVNGENGECCVSILTGCQRADKGMSQRPPMERVLCPQHPNPDLSRRPPAAPKAQGQSRHISEPKVVEVLDQIRCKFGIEIGVCS